MFKKIAQAEPAAAPPGGAPPAMPDLGMGGGMDLGLGAAPMGGAPAPAAPVGPKPPIKYPLDKINYILQDADIDQEIMGLNPIDEVVTKIWLMYGGDQNGGVDPNKKGERQPFKEVDDSELEATKNERYKRLPLGETLSSLGISLDEFNKAIVASSLSFSKSKSQAGQQGGGAMANIKLQNMVKLARILDLNGKYKEADKIFKY
jgi:hypothetical protein